MVYRWYIWYRSPLVGCESALEQTRSVHHMHKRCEAGKKRLRVQRRMGGQGGIVVVRTELWDVETKV